MKKLTGNKTGWIIGIVVLSVLTLAMLAVDVVLIIL
jgi:hypothetical protein